MIPCGLGRHEFRDPRNERFRIRAVMSSAILTPRRVMQDDRRLFLDQGETSRCTGAALLHYRAAGPVRDTGPRAPDLDPTYAAIRAIDASEGRNYPEGATSLALAKHAVARGWAGEYRWGYTADELFAALASDCVILGTEWHTGFDAPNADGIVRLGTTPSRGGHEYVVTGRDPARGLTRCKNSWGWGWGVRGHFWVPDDDMRTLLETEGGDCLILRELPAAPRAAGAAA